MGKFLVDQNGKVLTMNGKAVEITSSIDANISPENIKKGVTILDTEGAFDTDGLNGVFAVESKTVPISATSTINVAYSEHVGVLDENNKRWDLLDWHQRWVDNGYSAEGLSTPIGIWFSNAFGMKTFDLLWPLSQDYVYYDISGTTQNAANTFRHFMFETDPIITARSGNAFPAIGNIEHGTAGKYNDSAWNTTINGDGLDMYTANTKETFFIPSRNIAATNSFQKENGEDYMESYYQQCEFYRACFAICSGISTTQPNGTTTTVEILNSSGNQAAVGEDMYFWIEGTNTGLLAKYNLNSRLVTNTTTGYGTSYYLTKAISDAIYDKQKVAGINMNDTGINSSSKRILTEGAKGAEAVTVDGYWYIKTPYVSRPSSTTWTLDYNLIDSSATYLCRKRGVTLPIEKKLFIYWLNKSTLVTGLIGLLRDREKLTSVVPSVVSGACWTSLRYSASNAWCVNTSYGSLNYNNTSYRCLLVPAPASSEA